MEEENILSYIGYICLFSFIFFIGLIMLRTTSASLKNKEASGMYRTKAYNMLAKYFIFGSVFVIILGIIGIIQKLI